MRLSQSFQLRREFLFTRSSLVGFRFLFFVKRFEVTELFGFLVSFALSLRLGLSQCVILGRQPRFNLFYLVRVFSFDAG